MIRLYYRLLGICLILCCNISLRASYFKLFNLKNRWNRPIWVALKGARPVEEKSKGGKDAASVPKIEPIYLQSGGPGTKKTRPIKVDTSLMPFKIENFRIVREQPGVTGFTFYPSQGGMLLVWPWDPGNLELDVDNPIVRYHNGSYYYLGDVPKGQRPPYLFLFKDATGKNPFRYMRKEIVAAEKLPDSLRRPDIEFWLEFNPNFSHLGYEGTPLISKNPEVIKNEEIHGYILRDKQAYSAAVEATQEEAEARAAQE
jgi:hypothetical protein